MVYSPWPEDARRSVGVLGLELVVRPRVTRAPSEGLIEESVESPQGEEGLVEVVGESHRCCVVYEIEGYRTRAGYAGVLEV